MSPSLQADALTSEPPGNPNYNILTHNGFPRWLSGKEATRQAEDVGLIPESGRFSGGGIGYLLQYSYLGNPMDREAWWATVHGVAKSWTRLGANNNS